jgi:hypothetical protein
MADRCALALVASALVAVLGAPVPVSALVGDSDGAIGVDGSLRTVGAVVDDYDFAPFFRGAETDQLSETLLRLTVAGRPAPWLRYELHGVQTVQYSSATSGGSALPFLDLAPSAVRYRAVDLTADWRRAGDYTASLFVDRANVELSLPWAEVTVGRQAITLGKTYLWNPLDVFLAFDPRSFDQEYKPGVDAIRVEVPLGPFAGIDVIGAAGRTVSLATAIAGEGRTVDASWPGSAILARAYATVHGWDVALQGGKVFAGEQLGAGLSGEALGIELRGEAVLHLADQSPPLLPALRPADVRRLARGPLVIPRNVASAPPLVDDSVSAVVGVGHRFESSLVLETEYFQNGAGDAGDLEASLLRLSTGGVLAMSEHLVGGFATYDLLPILVGEVLGIVSLDDGSVQVQPRLRWSAADEVEVVAGAALGVGARPTTDALGLVRLRSEFGTFPDVYYAELKWYF